MGHVIIVGAGPAGATLAHLLGHRGVDVSLLERQSDFSREFRGEVLMPSGLAALEQIGVANLLESVPHYQPSSITAYLNRREIFTAGLASDLLEARPPLAVSQPGLLEALIGAAEKSGRVHFHRGASVKDVYVENGRMVGVRARTLEGEIELRGDLVVGTDGRASVVRRRGGFAARNTDLPMDIVWCKVPCPDGYLGVRAYLGRGHLLIAYHTWDHNLQVGWVILKGTYGDLRSQGIERWVEDMAAHVDDELGEHLRACQSLVAHPFLLDVVSDRVERWWVPGGLLLGDAAHTMSPVGGQGLNVALRDAIVAANHLVPVLSAASVEPTRVDRASEAVESERAPEIVQIQRLQSFPPRVILSRAWWGEPVRRVAGRLLQTGFGRARGAGIARQFLFGIGDVKLRV